MPVLHRVERYLKKITRPTWKYRFVIYLLLILSGTMTALGVGYLGLSEVNVKLHTLLEMNIWMIYYFDLAIIFTVEVLFKSLIRIQNKHLDRILAMLWLCFCFGIIFNFINDAYYFLGALL